MALETIPKSRVNRGGRCAVTIYVLIIIVVFIVTIYTGKPSDVGLQWVPFLLLSEPWYWISPALLFPGLLVNAILIYLLGTLLDILWCWILKD